MSSELKVWMSDVMSADTELDDLASSSLEEGEDLKPSPRAVHSLKVDLVDRGRVGSAPAPGSKPKPSKSKEGISKSVDLCDARTGSRPSQNGLNGNSLRTIGEGSESKELTATALQPILEKQLAYFSGAMEEDKYPIVTLPNVGLKQLEPHSTETETVSEELQTTLKYFKTLIRPEHLSDGVTLLLDARSSKTHDGAKHVLDTPSMENLVLPVRKVYVYMKPATLLTMYRPKTLVSPELATKLNLVYFYDQTTLFEQLEASNVTEAMGGTLPYNHDTWIHNRVQYEKMLLLHRKSMDKLPQTIIALNDFQVPANVKEAENLMQEDLKLKERLVNLIAEAEVSIDRFMSELREQYPSLEMNPATRDHITMMSLLNGMMEELKNKQEEFDDFWALHKARVDHMMRMCHFVRTAAKLQHLMQGHIDDLATSEVRIGDTLETALELGEKHEAFVSKCKETMDEHMAAIRTDAHSLLHPTFHPEEDEENMHAATKEAIATVREHIQNLGNTYQDMMSTCQQKRDLFIVCVKFHMNVRRCEQWNQDVLEFLAAQPMQEPTHQVAITILSHIDGFLDQMPPSQISTLKQLANALPGKNFKKTSQKVISKYDHTHELLEKRKANLLMILATSLAPPPKPPELEAPPTPPPKVKSKPAKSESNEPDGTEMESASRSSQLSSGSSSPSSSMAAERESDKNTVKGRQYVYRELVSTEQDYIRDLKIVVDSYYDEMDSGAENSIPLRLRGKRDIIFGNLLDIYMFHDEVFAQALEDYASCPEKVGECFLRHCTEFQMYSAYCKHRSNSETLINESTESQTFFKGIQMKLAHSLPLNSYLIKPIQRVTKYQLLLKDMMKHSVSAKESHTDLQAALDQMLKLLKNLNDSLHVVGLKGFPGALAEQGRLLVHDAFLVVESAGRLFHRGKERHVFLFEKVVVISKKVEAPVQRRNRKSDTYIYKDHLQMAEISVRETSEGPSQQFQITIHGQSKGMKFQAVSMEVRDMWVSEMRRLLQAQFTLMKDMVIKSGTLNRSTYRGRAKLSTITRDSRFSLKAPPPLDSPHAAKKSFADRFKINLKSRSTRKSDPRAKQPTNQNPGDSSMTSSCSVPPSIAYRVSGGGARSHENLRDDMRTPDSEVSEDTRSESISSDDEFTFYSDEEDEDSIDSIATEHYESLAPGAPRYYTAMSDYHPSSSDENGISLAEGHEVEVLGINQYGWWWVRVTNYLTNEVEEGWAPASYLQVSAYQTVPS